MSNENKISLFFSEGGSDKEYHAQIDAVDGGFEVSFRYGRRGSTLTCGKKTSSPVDFDSAKKVYDKLVKEKMSKGYTPDVSGAAYQSSPAGLNFTGILPQLLNALDEQDVPKYVSDPSWVMQEKFDGERRMILCDGKSVIGINRKGMEVALPQLLVDSALLLLDNEMPTEQFLIDGEIIGESFFAFDLLELNGIDRRNSPYQLRLELLEALVEIEAMPGEKGIMVVPSFFDKEEKQSHFDKVKSSRGEGVVFKMLYANVLAGRPNSGGNALKFKFVTEASVYVTGINPGKRSVSFCVFTDTDKGEGRVDIGNVTIPPNASIPQEGEILQVLYLYAYPGGSLFQPVYDRARPDQDAQDCDIGQLKYKREEAIAA